MRNTAGADPAVGACCRKQHHLSNLYKLITGQEASSVGVLYCELQ